jgi:cytochrome c553
MMVAGVLNERYHQGIRASRSILALLNLHGDKPMPRRHPAGPPRPWLVLLAGLLLAGPAVAQDALLGRNLAATCANCHGTNGQALGAMAPLAGMPADRLLALLAGYRSGSTPATVMHQISKGYSEAQLKLIAEHFAAQKPRP